MNAVLFATHVVSQRNYEYFNQKLSRP